MSFAALHKTSSRKIYLKECVFGCEGKITLYFNLFLLFDKIFKFHKEMCKELNEIKSYHIMSWVNRYIPIKQLIFIEQWWDTMKSSFCLETKYAYQGHWPGAMVTTRIPIGARSRAIGSVIPTIPPLDAEYAAWPTLKNNNKTHYKPCSVIHLYV